MVKLWKYNLKNPGNGNNTTFHIPNEIKDTLWPEAYKAANKGQTLPQPSGDFQLENSEFTRNLLTQPHASQVYVSPLFTKEQIQRLLSEGNCYQLAKELAAEVNGNLIDYKCISNFESELKSYVAEIKKDGYEDKDLKEWLKKAKRPFLDTLLTSLDAEQSLINTPSVSKKRKELPKLVKDDTEKVAWIKYYYNESKEGQADIKYAKEEQEKLKDEYTAAREAVQEAKEGLESNLDKLVKCCIYTLNDSQQQTIQSNDARIDREKALKQRQRARYKGLLEYSKGVAAATIDGIAPQYMDAAQKVGTQVMRATDNIIASHSTEGVEAKSIEQTKLVNEAIPDTAKTLINAYASDDSLRNALSRSLLEPESELGNLNGSQEKQSVTV